MWIISQWNLKYCEKYMTRCSNKSLSKVYLTHENIFNFLGNWRNAKTLRPWNMTLKTSIGLWKWKWQKISNVGIMWINQESPMLPLDVKIGLKKVLLEKTSQYLTELDSCKHTVKNFHYKDSPKRYTYASHYSKRNLHINNSSNSSKLKTSHMNNHVEWLILCYL